MLPSNQHKTLSSISWHLSVCCATYMKEMEDINDSIEFYRPDWLLAHAFSQPLKSSEPQFLRFIKQVW